MADKKISALTTLAAADYNAATDYLPIIDPSEALPADQNKKIFGNVVTGLKIQGKTANYTVVAADHGTVINVTSGSVTISLTAAATLGDGFWCWVMNGSSTQSHTTTIDPNGTETIDGASASVVLRRGMGMLLICNGSNWISGAPKRIAGFATNFYGIENPIVTGNRSFGFGSGAAPITVSGDYSAGFFYGTASGENSWAWGNEAGGTATASQKESIAWGSFSSAAVIGKSARASGNFSGSGSAQRGEIVLRIATTDATPTALTSDGGAASTNNQVILPNSSTFRVTGHVVAMQQAADGTATASYSFVALVRRGANAAATTLPFSSVTTEFETTAGWDLTLSADTTNGGLAITATGAAATDIRWVCVTIATEVTYA